MKELIREFYGAELKWFRSLTARERIAAVYVAASLFIFIASTASDSAALLVVSITNMAVAMRIGGRLFRSDEEEQS